MRNLTAATPPRSRERGQSLVELAISLTVMLLLLSGAVTFGMALFSYVAIRDAAQEGALYGSFNPYLDANVNHLLDPGEEQTLNTAAIVAHVRAASTSPVNLASTTVVPPSFITVTATSAAACGGQPCACEGTTTVGGVTTANAIRVTVRYDYPIIMPFVGAIIGPTIHLSASVTDTILEPKCP